MLVKVVAVQSKLGAELTLEERLLVFRQRPDFVCLPEYFFVGRKMRDFGQSAMEIKKNLRYLEALSDALSTCLIGGSVVEAEGDAFYNSSYVYNRGERMGRYRKLNPVAGELDRGILPGDKALTLEIDGIKIGLLICADALNPDIFGIMREKEVDIIFIPTTSPFRPGEGSLAKQKRDFEIYLTGARRAGAYVVKTCAVGELFGKPLQGRSLMVSPWEIIRRVDIRAESTACVLSAVLDIEELRDFRQKFPVRKLKKA